MSVKPTTTLGYHFGIRQKSKATPPPTHGRVIGRQQVGGTFSFKASDRRPRMAGDIDIHSAKPDFLRPPIKGLWLKTPKLRTSPILAQPPGGRPISDETDFF